MRLYSGYDTVANKSEREKTIRLTIFVTLFPRISAMIERNAANKNSIGFGTGDITAIPKNITIPENHKSAFADSLSRFWLLFLSSI